MKQIGLVDNMRRPVVENLWTYSTVVYSFMRITPANNLE